MKESAAYRMLASADRQLLLYELERADGPLTEEELARRVAARRYGISPEKISTDKVERAHVRLVHKHFPLLLGLDVIERSGGGLVLNDERREQWIVAAKTMEAWPPEEWSPSLPA